MRSIRQSRGSTAAATAVLALSLPLLAGAGSAQAWTAKVLYRFTGGNDGWEPNGDLVRDPSTGDLYGTTLFGGAHGYGTVFKVTPDGAETVLYNFTKEIEEPFAGLIRDAAGNMYGTACCGKDSGALFRIASGGSFTVLHAFGKNGDGAQPESRLLLDGTTGDLYGTTSSGGASNCGVVFRLTPNGKYEILHSFSGGPDCDPKHSGVTMDPAGNLYGATFGEGHYKGAVYKLAPDGTETVLHRFNGKDGKWSQFGVVMDGLGNIFGATPDGGSNEVGVAFKIAPDGSYTVLHNFDTGPDSPWGNLLLEPSGTIYGTTHGGGSTDQGMMYRLKPNGAEKALYRFGDTFEFPQGGLIEDEHGNLYGAAAGFYPYDYGTVFELVK